MEKDPHQLIEGVLIACYAIGCRAGLPLRAGRDGAGAGAHRRRPSTTRTRPATSARTSSAPTSRWTSCCTGARAPTSSARRRRSSSRSRATAACRGSSRRSSPPPRASTSSPRSSTTSRRSPTSHGSSSNGGAEFAEARHREGSRGSGCFAVSGHVKKPGRVRGGVRRHHVPRPHLLPRLLRRHARRPRAEGVHPRRRLGALVLRRAPRHAPRAGRGRPGRLDARLGRHRRHGRHHRHGEGVLAARALLRPRVVRQVHAVPRGHQLAGEDPARASSAGEGRPDDLDLLLDVCDNISPGIAWPPQEDDDLPPRPVGGVADRVGARCTSGTSSRPTAGTAESRSPRRSTARPTSRPSPRAWRVTDTPRRRGRPSSRSTARRSRPSRASWSSRPPSGTAPTSRASATTRGWSRSGCAACASSRSTPVAARRSNPPA